MKQLLSDTIGFMKNLNFMDFILYFSILALIILVVSLIYIIKISDEEEEEIEAFNNEDIDLHDVVYEIENTSSSNIPYTIYERDQEEKAIISYEELLAKNKTGSLNYNEESILEDNISVKKIDLDHLININEGVQEEKNAEIDSSKLFKFASEEAFLKALQSLNEILN